MKRYLRYAIAVCLVLGTASAAWAGSVTLKRAFVEKYKNRATIDASFIVDHAHPHPNPPQKDGDMHVAGRAQKDVGLPMVAEVMNAAAQGQNSAVKDIHADEGVNKTITVSGVWLFWFEHPSAAPQVQFDPVAAEPAAATGREHGRLGQFLEAQHPRVKAAQGVLTARRAGQLHVMDHPASGYLDVKVYGRGYPMCPWLAK